jgi:uroporphyrinogen-III synthase
MTYTLVVCKPKLPPQYLVQKESLKGELESYGLTDVLYFPVFDIVPYDTAMTQITLWAERISTRPNQLIVFVSPSALEIVLSNMPVWPAHVFCGVMGLQSATLASKLGVPETKILYPAGHCDFETEDSNGLLYLIAKNFDRDSCEVLVCKGPRGRVDFPPKLNTMGHQVEVLECYDRQVIEYVKQDYLVLFNKPSNMIFWITSSETIEVLDRQLVGIADPILCELRQYATLLTTHPRIAAKCRELGYVHVVQISTGIQSLNSWLILNKRKHGKH